jgi:hypothetical protein
MIDLPYGVREIKISLFGFYFIEACIRRPLILDIKTWGIMDVVCIRKQSGINQFLDKDKIEFGYYKYKRIIN